MSANLGYLFYKEYFDAIRDYTAIDASEVSHFVDELISRDISIDVPDEEYMGNRHLKATTSYPGLLLGIGNIHELPSVDGQAILGFHFDYTTGLPVIPGSSIKGVLRSAFSHQEYVRELLRDIIGDSSIAKTLNIGQLEEEIFGQPPGDDRTQQGADLFFDAQIISVVGKVLADDYLAPHGDNPTHEPNVLRFIKVAPGVTFRFDFGLSDQEMLLTASERFDLYRSIIEDFGMGAKTNVGYGYFTDIHSVLTEAEQEAIREKEIAQLCIKMSQSEEIDKIEDFIRRYPEVSCIEAINERLEELKKQKHIAEIRAKWDKVEKQTKKHIQTFLDSHRNQEGIEDIIQEAEELLNSKKSGSKKTLDDLPHADKPNELKAILDDITIQEKDYDFIEEHVVRVYNKNKKSNFWSTVQLGNKDKELEKRIKQKVGVMEK
jgi:CRISPR-associated protein Cmr6